MRKAGEEEDWKKKTRDRGEWKRISDEAVKKLQAAPDPWQRENEEEREIYIHVRRSRDCFCLYVSACVRVRVCVCACDPGK